MGNWRRRKNTFYWCIVSSFTEKDEMLDLWVEASAPSVELLEQLTGRLFKGQHAGGWLVPICFHGPHTLLSRPTNEDHGGSSTWQTKTDSLDR